MIHTDARGAVLLLEVLLADPFDADWSIWEEAFLEQVREVDYKNMTNKQKNVISRLHDKLLDL